MSNEFAATPEKEELGCDEEIVAAYLLQHADFFDRHPEILAALEVGCGADKTTSLVEKQLAVLRKKSSDVEADRAALIETARANANLSVCLHKTAVELLRTAAPNPMCLARRDKAGRVSRVCRTVFQQYVPGVRLFIHWFTEFLPNDDGSNVVALDGEGQRGDDPRLAGLVDSLFLLGESSCGPFNEAERIALFGRFSSSLRSAVVAPLLEPMSKDRMGILVLASTDPACFSPGKGTMFLVQLMQLIEGFFSHVDETETAS